MKIIRKYINFFVLVLPLLSFSQKVNNIHFEQVGKQIHIYYDLQGDDEYTIQVYCSIDNEHSWGGYLNYVTGDLKNQYQGKNKLIVWDVLEERENLSGNIRFKLECILSLSGYFSDKRDGKKYKWVRIGDQVWMSENLAYKIKRGCNAYDDNKNNVNQYGYLYNWYTAKTACPDGWHLPSDEEWKILEGNTDTKYGVGDPIWDNLENRGYDAGKHLKTTAAWSSNTGTNAVDFSALPGGFRYPYGHFNYLGTYGYWWSSTTLGSRYACHRSLNSNLGEVYRYDYNDKENGYSVRCLRD